MSKIGKKPITIPKGVKVLLGDNEITFEGKLGKLTKKINLETISVEIQDDKITVSNNKPLDKKSKAMYGTVARAIQNGIKGVEEGFNTVLYLNGVGYKGVIKKDSELPYNYIILSIGKSYEPRVIIPDGVNVVIEKKTVMKISGSNPELIGQFRAVLQSLRRRNPYKGSGILTPAERLLPLKQGKTKSK
ncbi:MAG: 50S ribosomal protein L6 [Pseudomonadota bacterium]